MKVFIGSSGEQKKLVDWITAFIRGEYKGLIEPVPWTVPWPGGRYILENLLAFVEDTDAAILFWTADDLTWYRETKRHEPRDNLVFEAGLFIASHGWARTQLMVPIYSDEDDRRKVSPPSDVAGMTWNTYAWGDGAIEATGLPNTARVVCDRLVGLGTRPRVSDKLKHLRGLPGVEELKTFVGEWKAIHSNAIARLAEKPDAQEIDVLVAYRVGEIRKVITDFKKRKGSKLRVLFANLFDDDLCAAYRRKYYDREPDQLRTYLLESIQLLLSPCKVNVEGQDVVITEVAEPPEAEYDIRLTNQRITFSYYRVNDCSFLLPLDMKKEQSPAPLVWVVEKETSPLTYDFYLREYNAVFKEAKSVIIRK
jgi:CAP12/Pycsar effector protein, TIR domain